MTAAEARGAALEILLSSKSVAAHESPSLDVSIILSHFLGVPRSHLIAHPETPIDAIESTFFDAIKKRAEGLPVAYITGTKEFWGIPFMVSPDVLIPKPDTEILVERAIAVIDHMSAHYDEPIRVLDVCTGSGCVAISLKTTRENIAITATDISNAALAVARFNAGQLPVAFIENDLRDGLPQVTGGYHLVVSNPPYVPTAVTKELLADGRTEPSLALDGGSDGLDLVRSLVDNVRMSLVKGGVLLVETGEYNAQGAAEYFREKGFVNVLIHKDLEGMDRVIEGTLV
jgi:release factor glutamine methyltransferase